ncbi:LPXTG cell wall anchor domain-containing protein [Streptococcus suis]|nr:LPXTG cell wall anchor domain-containing protein [Streptococcus suis]
MKIKRSSSKKQLHKWTRLGLSLAAVTVLGGLVEPGVADFGLTKVYATEQADPALEARKAEIKTMIQSYRDLVGQIKALNPADYTEESWNKNYDGDVRIYLGAQSIATAYNDDLTFSSLSLDGIDSHQTLNELNATYMFGYHFVENSIPILKQAMADLVPVSKSVETPVDTRPVGTSVVTPTDKPVEIPSTQQAPKTATFITNIYDEDGSKLNTLTEQVVIYPNGSYTFDLFELFYSLKAGQVLTYHYDEIEDGGSYSIDKVGKSRKLEEGMPKTVVFRSYDYNRRKIFEETVTLSPGESYTFSVDTEMYLPPQKITYTYDDVMDNGYASLYLEKRAKKNEDQSISFEVVTNAIFYISDGVGEYPIEYKSITLKKGESLTLTPPVYEGFELSGTSPYSQSNDFPLVITNDGKSEIKGVYSILYNSKQEENLLPTLPKDYAGGVLASVEDSYLLKVVHRINGEFRHLDYYSVPAKGSVAPELLVHSGYGQLLNYTVSDFYGFDNKRRDLTLNYHYPKDRIPESLVDRIPLAQGVWPAAIHSMETGTTSQPAGKPVETPAEKQVISSEVKILNLDGSTYWRGDWGDEAIVGTATVELEVGADLTIPATVVPTGYEITDIRFNILSTGVKELPHTWTYEEYKNYTSAPMSVPEIDILVKPVSSPATPVSPPAETPSVESSAGQSVNTPTSPGQPSTSQTTKPVSKETTPIVNEELEPSKLASLDSYKDVTEASSSVNVRVHGQDMGKVVSLSVTKENDPSVFAKLPQGLAEHQVDLYDIKTLDTRGQFVQITEEATVTLPVAAGKEIEKVIYFLASTGAVEELPFTVDKANNQVSFTVSHFSHYGIVYQASKPVSQVQPGSVSQSVQPVVAPSIQSNQTGSSSHTQTKESTVKPASTSQSQAKSLPATGEVSSVLHLTGLGLLGLAGLVVKRRPRKSS